jgi:hypothetical protein
VKILLLSTYELGRQPIHLASPLAALAAAGHQAKGVDLAVEELDQALVAWADAAAISVPMHTATRLATGLVEDLKRRRPDLPVALYGLYAGVAEGSGADALFAGEYEPALLEWAHSLASGIAAPTLVTFTGRSELGVPRRDGLATLDQYARLEDGEETRLAGSVEASHGCRHRCRHCPIPPLYDGRMRVVPKPVVLADIDQLVAAGAGHISFADPDFLNAPRHSLDLLAAAHQAHPEVTFDVTAKVEHILADADIWPRLAELNLAFVISAFESVDAATLEILDKGHTAADMAEAVAVLRGAGVHLRPTWLPFLPWTEADHIVALFRFLDQHRLWEATDPVQLSIKLLIPPGSLLEHHPAVIPHLGHLDRYSLAWQWEFTHHEVEVLQKELAAIAAEGSDCGDEALATLGEMRRAVERRTRIRLGPLPTGEGPVPRLTESWFCCAEPTEGQAERIGVTLPPPVVE